MMSVTRILPWALAVAGVLAPCLAAAAQTRQTVADLDITTFPEPARVSARQMLGRDAAARLREAGRRESDAWHQLTSQQDWEAYARPRIDRMRTALNVPAGPRRPPRVIITRRIAGDGWGVACIAFESRPGVVVTGNLYRPANAGDAMPGIVISHSHHNPKSESELRDMGASWARAGCCVIVPDHLGHGERRQHPFKSADDYPKSFRAGRQDYYFRYVSSLQLYAAGETLAGWMAHDLSTAVDVLLAQPGIDPRRIALLGAVAGGGDPAAVTAALDPRITAIAPFNFGGPQPETRFPLPDDAETWFNYAGGGSWESTRNLYRSAEGGFLPWVIVASVAPRTLVYGHEFAWDQPRDPVWKRLGTVWGWYGVGTLGSAAGRGGLSGRTPEATHCNNIGPVQRKGVAAWLKRAANFPEPVDGASRPAAEDLLVDPASAGLKPMPLHAVLAKSAGDRGRAEAERLAKLPPAERVIAVREAWRKLLSQVEPPADPTVQWLEPRTAGGVSVRSTVLTTERELSVPLTFLSATGFATKRPAVLMFAQQGKQKLLATRADDVAKLLDAGFVVCLADLRGFGETAAGSGRGRSSEATSVAASCLMLGDPLIAGQLRDLRAVMALLRKSEFVDPNKVAVWGDSLAEPNPPGVNAGVPLDVDQPNPAEPAAALLAVLAGVFEKPSLVYARGGIIAYGDLLRSPFVHVPLDAIVPGAIPAGDVVAVKAAAGINGGLRTAGTVNAWNQFTEADAQAGDGAAAWVIERLGTR